MPKPLRRATPDRWAAPERLAEHVDADARVGGGRGTRRRRSGNGADDPTGPPAIDVAGLGLRTQAQDAVCALRGAGVEHAAGQLLLPQRPSFLRYCPDRALVSV